MDSLKELVGSIINSFLGPNKSNKCVVQDKELYLTRCPLHIFQSTLIQDPLSTLIEETLFAHHELYGCSTLTLLAMWYFWHEEFKFALEEGYEMQDIIMHSWEILELVISSLSDITINLNSLLFFKNSGCEKSLEIQFKKMNAFGQVPISILYSSRHFSPTQTAFDSEDESRKYDKGNSELDENSLNTVVQRLNHGEDNEMCNLILECWKRQISSTNCSKFQTDSLHICPVILPCSNSTVVDGLIIKSNSNYTFYQDMNNTNANRTLIIKGSLTFQHVHLGFAPKVLISTHKCPDLPLISEKEKWKRKCCRCILQLKLDVLLITDDIDSEIADFCLSHSILVLPHTPLNVLKVLCHTLQYSPCTYIWDCNEESVLRNITIKEWKPHDSISCDKQYFLCSISSASMLPLQTIVLCHPSQAVLDKTKHQIWHLASRLKLCFQSKKLLPGGEVEEWCSNFLRKCPQFHKTFNPSTRISIALANGFRNYSKLVSSKKALSTDSSIKVLDEMSSKLSAWQSALSLVLLVLQCDTAILNGIEDLTTKQTVNLNVRVL